MAYHLFKSSTVTTRSSRLPLTSREEPGHSAPAGTYERCTGTGVLVTVLSPAAIRRVLRLCSGGTGFAGALDGAVDRRDPLRAERRDLLWDTGLVGVGLIAGAVASICSLFAAA